MHSNEIEYFDFNNAAYLYIMVYSLRSDCKAKKQMKQFQCTEL